jgi:hypothetical protein
LSPQKSRTSVTVGVCCGGVATGKAWTLHANNDPKRLQAKKIANLFDMGSFPHLRAIVDRQKTAAA